MAPICLTDMPNELIAKIVDHTLTSSLSSLALVSRRFTSLVEPKLYKSIFYVGVTTNFSAEVKDFVRSTNTRKDPKHKDNQKINPYLGTRVYSLAALVRSLEENEYLCDLVLEAKLRWGRYLDEMDRNKDATTRLLSLLHNLRVLQLLPGHVYFTHIPSAQISFLQLCMPTSERVSLKLLEPLLSNKFLRNLSIASFHSWAYQAELPDRSANPPPSVASKSSISHLAVSSSICSAATMEGILNAPKALTCLHYRYSGRQLPKHNAIIPSNFQIPLLPHQSSLEELVIYAQPHQHISGQHPVGDFMEPMQSFIALKRLGLPAWWMARPSSEHHEGQTAGVSSTAKLVQMLPPGLEILQVQIEDVRLDCPCQEMYEHLSRKESMAENFDKLVLRLKEIAVLKQDYVSMLKEVVVWSSNQRSLHERKMLCESDIEDVFLKQDVSLKFICDPDSRVLFGINGNF